MNLTNEGLSLWYGTPDAPAPGDVGVVPRRGASLVVGAHPANPANSVRVHYRVDGGRVQTVAGRELRTDYGRQAQYFGATFPEFSSGNIVEYLPVLSCTGRQVPAAHVSSRFPSKFQLDSAEVGVKNARLDSPPQRRAATNQRYDAGLDFLASVAVHFFEPQYLGDTPIGVRINFVVKEGTVRGNGFKASVLEYSTDHLIVRPDGVGIIRIRGAFATPDGALLDVETGGYVDFGPDGYRRALARDLPDRSPLLVAPLVSTRHPRYRWLSRIQCVGVGYTNLADHRANYDLYAVSPRALK